MGEGAKEARTHAQQVLVSEIVSSEREFAWPPQLDLLGLATELQGHRGVRDLDNMIEAGRGITTETTVIINIISRARILMT